MDEVAACDQGVEPVATVRCRHRAVHDQVGGRIEDTVSIVAMQRHDDTGHRLIAAADTHRDESCNGPQVCSQQHARFECLELRGVLATLRNGPSTLSDSGAEAWEPTRPTAAAMRRHKTNLLQEREAAGGDLVLSFERVDGAA